MTTINNNDEEKTTLSVNDISEEEYEKYEKNMDKMRFLFGNLKFGACGFDYDKLDEVIVDSNKAVIKHSYNCYCVEGTNMENRKEYIKIELEEGKKITLFDFYNYCNKKWCYKIYNFCNHSSFEGVNVVKLCGDYYIEPLFGS